MDVDNEEPNKEEIEPVMNALKNNKSSGQYIDTQIY